MIVHRAAVLKKTRKYQAVHFEHEAAVHNFFQVVSKPQQRNNRKRQVRLRRNAATSAGDSFTATEGAAPATGSINGADAENH